MLQKAGHREYGRQQREVKYQSIYVYVSTLMLHSCAAWSSTTTCSYTKSTTSMAAGTLTKQQLFACKTGQEMEDNNEEISSARRQLDLEQQNPDKNITKFVSFESKLERLYNLQSQIDRLLHGPDPPFDLRAELKKVKSIAPSSTPAPLPEDLHTEKRIMALEEDVEAAKKAQDFERAAHSQHAIQKLHIDDCGAVLQVNAAYYKAFSAKDYQAMHAVWCKDNTAICIHPSQEPLIGSKAVLQSFSRMFQSQQGTLQRSWIEPTNIRISIKGSMTAVVVCDEHVYARLFIRGHAWQTELVNKLTSTNIFRKISGKWLLSHHHGSWHADSRASKQALTIKGWGGEGVESLNSDRSSSSPTSLSSLNDDDDDEDADHRHAIGGDEDGRDDDQDDAVAKSMDGIMGIPNYGQLLGDEKPKDATKNRKGKRGVIMSSLKDILGGGLGDILDRGVSGGTDVPGGRAIIRVSRVIKGNSNTPRSHAGMNMDEELTEYEDEDDGDGDGSNEKDLSTLRTQCISALRKLCDIGAICPNQKRVLITNIITCAKDMKQSMVEVAHQLLLGGSNDSSNTDSSADIALEEFADQCRFIATALLQEEEATSSSTST